LAFVVAGTILAANIFQGYHDARATLQEGQRQLQNGAYREAVHTFARGKAKAENLPGGTRLTEELDFFMCLARRAHAAENLHSVAENLRFLAGADLHSLRELQALEGHCRIAWAARTLVAGTQSSPFDAAFEERIRADLLDVALFGSELKRRLAQRENVDHSAEIQTLLTEAGDLLGPTAALARERQMLASNGKVDGQLPTGRDVAWEHTSLGLSLLRSGELERARTELERAIELRPQDFWPHFYQGVCAFRRRQYADAVHAFDVAIALSPSSPECYFNRAVTYAAWGKNTLALKDYDRTLTLAPHLGTAAMNRGVLHYQEKRYTQARQDLEQALLHGADPASIHYALALVQFALNDRKTALQHVEQVLQYNPQHTEARTLQTRLRSKE